ncbi:unnamed protein product [Phyllotreta striolata]|uniref:Pre-mRNA polyadenylation factor Fip1 domain-containing protein n=1 Tax=Phyllotreta striolata TaxID=444603 RepID=A0A9N9TV99_PHYSR|nr:unnamed protein product [Phyllotreta striolata]
MADDIEDDQWLYGDTPDISAAENETTEKEPPESEENVPQEDSVSQEFQPPADDGPPGVDAEETEKDKENEEPGPEPMEDGEVQQNGDDSEREDDDDDSDDDVNVVIGDIKATTPSYTSLNIKRTGLLTSVDKNKQVQQQPTGKFAVEEFEQIGTINGVLASEYNLDSLEDKPWKKPGADITDYFNYGFNEDTWRAYCERQNRMRLNESGAGLVPMTMMAGIPRGPVPIMNDNSKYGNKYLGGNQQRNMQQPINKVDQVPKVNTIQVMTADRREYSRKPGFPDMTVPPPATFEPYHQPEYGFNPEPEPFYGGGYEPTQDSQWGKWSTEPPPGWTPSELKTLTGPPPMGPPQMHMGLPPMMGMRSPNSRRDSSPHKERERDKESRSRSEKPRDRDRERERSHRRERSRSRSRRHRSRSRSPSHRSHRKKKSKRHDDSE